MTDQEVHALIKLVFELIKQNDRTALILEKLFNVLEERSKKL